MDALETNQKEAVALIAVKTGICRTTVQIRRRNKNVVVASIAAATDICHETALIPKMNLLQ